MAPARGALRGDRTRCQEPRGRVPVTLLQADTSSRVARVGPPRRRPRPFPPLQGEQLKFTSTVWTAVFHTGLLRFLKWHEAVSVFCYETRFLKTTQC